MTELERFAAALLTESESEGARAEASMTVGALLDRTFPYATAKRILGIETAEDYETLLLRLIAEEGGMTITTPGEAAEMARAAMNLRVPDLDALRRLRSAALAFTDDALSRLDGVKIMPPVRPQMVLEEAAHDPGVIPIRPRREVADATAVATPTTGEGTCWSCGEPFPDGRLVNFCVECGADQRVPRCGSCGVEVDRAWRHCPECGNMLELK